MGEIPNYSRYTWEQLQEELAHINREREAESFLALQSEIERRLNQPPLPEAAATASPSPIQDGLLPNGLGCGCGGLAGFAFGAFVGTVIAYVFAGRLEALNPGDEGVMAQLGCIFGGAVVCSCLGMILGVCGKRRLSL